MPTLEWMGKSKVVAYHRQVPYRVLERCLLYTSDAADEL